MRSTSSSAAIDESPGELTILAQAPLTNLATAVARDPSIAAKVGHLYVMGGGEGNITPAAEYNFFVDPEAAKIVLNAGFPLTLFTWSLTRTHGVFDDARLARIDALGHAARRVLRPGEPEGARVRRQGQPPRRLDASRLDGLRGDRRAVARAGDGGGGRRRRDARRADARLEPDRHARPGRPRAERDRRHRLRHRGLLRAAARAARAERTCRRPGSSACASTPRRR